MFSRSHLRLLSVLAIVIAIAQASGFDLDLQRRQDTSNDGGLLGGIVSGVTAGLSLSLGSGGSSTASGSSTKSTPSSTPSSTPGSTTPPSSTPSSTPPPTSSTPPPTSTPTSSTKQDSTSSKSDDDSSTTQPPSSFTSVTVVTTVVDGSTLVSQSTYTSKPTGEASLNNGSPTKTSGMSDSTKKTVIGVVVGVGGAIILAGLGIVAYRIWGRKKNEDESDGLMGFRTGSAGHEKTGSLSSPGVPPANPFQTTLDQYHNPNRHVNASSNF